MGASATRTSRSSPSNYRGGHAASRAQAGFTCYGAADAAAGGPFDPRVAEDFI